MWRWQGLIISLVMGLVFFFVALAALLGGR